MMKHKTSELEGVLLDAAVALALGAEYVIVNGEGCHALVSQQETPGFALSGCQIDRLSAYRKFRPSTDWSDGGPIIERERIAAWKADGDWCAAVPGDSAYHGDCDYIDVTRRDGSSGPTPLIAAMRAYVASKLGEEVEL